MIKGTKIPEGLEIYRGYAEIFGCDEIRGGKGLHRDKGNPVSETEQLTLLNHSVPVEMRGIDHVPEDEGLKGCKAKGQDAAPRVATAVQENHFVSNQRVCGKKRILEHICLEQSLHGPTRYPGVEISAHEETFLNKGQERGEARVEQRAQENITALHQAARVEVCPSHDTIRSDEGIRTEGDILKVFLPQETRRHKLLKTHAANKIPDNQVLSLKQAEANQLPDVNRLHEVSQVDMVSGDKIVQVTDFKELRALQIPNIDSQV